MTTTTTIYDQGSFKPVARLAWLRDDIPQPANDEPIFDDSYSQVEVKPKSKIEVYHYHNDQLGTFNELTNQQGEVVWLADYEAWGNTARVVWNENQLEQLQVSQDELQPIRFQGQYYDEETGLHYNRFRYYDPDVGMFTSRDPIGLMGGDNVFAYAPNPIRWVDPLGLKKDILDERYNRDKPWGKNIPIFDPNRPHKEWPRYSGKGPFGGVCGAEGSVSSTWIVPDGSNRAACQAHDDCYSTCGRSKRECDNEFAANGAKKYAWVLTDVLTSASQEAYDSAQQEAGCCNDCTQ